MREILREGEGGSGKVRKEEREREEEGDWMRGKDLPTEERRKGSKLPRYRSSRDRWALRRKN